MPNYSYQDPDIPNGTVIEQGNFTQLLPETEIMVGKTLTINDGNFTNVKRQPEWTVNGGTWFQVDGCTNLDPRLITLGQTPCEENCRHVVDTDTLDVDGDAFTVYQYEHTVT